LDATALPIDPLSAVDNPAAAISSTPQVAQVVSVGEIEAPHCRQETVPGGAPGSCEPLRFVMRSALCVDRAAIPHPGQHREAAALSPGPDPFAARL
jgi:hypothetical protein